MVFFTPDHPLLWKLALSLSFFDKVQFPALPYLLQPEFGIVQGFSCVGTLKVRT